MPIDWATIPWTPLGLLAALMLAACGTQAGVPPVPATVAPVATTAPEPATAAPTTTAPITASAERRTLAVAETGCGCGSAGCC